jgi:hypothetical protein
MCRVRSAEEAGKLSKSLDEFMHETCTVFSPGEIFIIYFVWWAEADGKNRDIAYLLQVDGELRYSDIKDQHFQPIRGLLEVN